MFDFFPSALPTSVRSIRARVISAVIAFVGIVSATYSQRSGPETTTFPTFTLAQLQSDFDQFSGTVATQHPQLYSDRAAVESALFATRAQLREGMSELEFFRLLSGVVSRLNCGHTSLALSTTTEAAVNATRRLLPFDVKFIDGRLFVTRVLPGSSVPAGAEVIEINGRSSAEILRQLVDRLPADGTNLTSKVHNVNGRFAELHHLLIDTSAEFSIAYLSPDTRTAASTILAGVTSGERAALQDPPTPDHGGLGSTAFDTDHAVLFVKSFFFYDAAGRARFNAFVDDFFNEVAARKIRSVILDLRGNGGGDPYCGAYLFRRLIDRPLPYFASSSAFYQDLKPALAPAANAFDGSVHILADGGVFSTTGHLVSLLKFHAIGRFIGEETGGSFACTANNLTATLLRTRLRFSYATATFTTAVSGLTPGRGIMPDFPITRTIGDHLAHRDAAKNLALSLIAKGVPSVAITRSPESMTAASAGRVFFSTQAAGAGTSLQWQFNGADIANATATELSIDSVQLAHAGLYSAVAARDGAAQRTLPAILGFVSEAKSLGGSEIGPDIAHPNGLTFDQVLLHETAASITADRGQVTRISYVDLQDDIVQVEFSGAGTLSLTLDAASSAAPPLKYLQPGVSYRKGHARLVIAGADDTTNVAVFTVGRANAVDQTLFRDDVAYDGWADLASIAILSANGKFGGLFMGNAILTGNRGPVGVIAPGVEFTGRVAIGDLHAADDATPMILLGSAADIRIAGGNLEQLNARPVQVSGIVHLPFVSGTDSHDRIRTAQASQARLEQDGIDVTASLVNIAAASSSR